MSEFNKLVDRNYHAIVGRGLINPDTTDREFINKMAEELREIQIAHDCGVSENELLGEIVDLMSVCASRIKHKGYDVQEIFEKYATVKNEWRSEHE